MPMSNSSRFQFLPTKSIRGRPSMRTVVRFRLGQRQRDGLLRRSGLIKQPLRTQPSHPAFRWPRMQAVQDFFLGEWYFSIPLVVMSLIAAALVMWRFMLNGSAKTDMDEFLPVFQDTLRKTGIKG